MASWNKTVPSEGCVHELMLLAVLHSVLDKVFLVLGLRGLAPWVLLLVILP